jgi:hypothetical protein
MNALSPWASAVIFKEEITGFGFITFEKPGSVFSYTADGQQELTSEEATELFEHLSDVRDNPALWNEPER